MLEEDILHGAEVKIKGNMEEDFVKSLNIEWCSNCGKEIKGEPHNSLLVVGGKHYGYCSHDCAWEQIEQIMDFLELLYGCGG